MIVGGDSAGGALTMGTEASFVGLICFRADSEAYQSWIKDSAWTSANLSMSTSESGAFYTVSSAEL